MVVFDKNIVDDPIDKIDNIKTPNEAREGPIVNSLNDHLLNGGSSYHNTDPKRGHWSASDGCKRRAYLNYVHKLDDDLEPLPNSINSEWTFKHGDAVHEMIQAYFVEMFGEEHVTIEETVEYDIDGEFYTYGHADIVIRGLDMFPDPFVIDIKTKSEFKYYNYGKKGHARTVPSESNMMQLNGYMGALGADVGALLYYSKRNDHLEEYWMNYDPDLFTEGIENITEVLHDVKNGTPSKRDSSPYLCDPEYCNYYREGLCQGVDEVDVPDNYNPNRDDFSYEGEDWQ